MINRKRIDAKASRKIEAAGWEILPRLGDSFVARRGVREDDGSITTKYETGFSLEALAQACERRNLEKSTFVSEVSA